MSLSEKWIRAHHLALTCKDPIAIVKKLIEDQNEDDPLCDYVAFLVMRAHLAKISLYPLMEPLCRKNPSNTFPTLFILLADLGYKIKMDDNPLISSIFNILDKSTNITDFVLASRIGFPISHNNFALLPKLIPYLKTIDDYLNFLDANAPIAMAQLFPSKSEISTLLTIMLGFHDKSEVPQDIAKKLQVDIFKYADKLLKLKTKYPILKGLDDVNNIITALPRASFTTYFKLQEIIKKCQ